MGMITLFKFFLFLTSQQCPYHHYKMNNDFLIAAHTQSMFKSPFLFVKHNPNRSVHCVDSPPSASVWLYSQGGVLFVYLPG